MISYGYTGDMDWLAWDAAHKFGTRMVAEGLVSFGSGVIIGRNALAAEEYISSEYAKFYKSCEEFGRRKRMQQFSATLYRTAEEKFGVEIKLF